LAFTAQATMCPQVVRKVLCPSCDEVMELARVHPGVMSRLYISPKCKLAWLLFGEHLYPCADVSGLLLPGQM